jgi:hypothetical protein
MIESRSCSGRATAPLRGCRWRPTTRITAGRMPAANAMGTAAAGTTSTAAGVGTSTSVSTAPVGTAVKTAAMGAPVRTAATAEFAATGVAMATTMRTTAVGPAAVRTFPAMLGEGGVGGAGKGERSNGCKQDAYG